VKTVVCVGEVMVELSGMSAEGLARIGFGGDTANTAVYLARLASGQAKIGYLTRLGDDPFGLRIADALRAEAILLPPTAVQPGRQTGLYAIEVAADGSRSFHYWRSASPARDLLTAGNAEVEAAFATSCHALYFSGITLAIMSPQGRENLLAAARRVRAKGGIVMFDLNYRPGLWRHMADAGQIGEIYREFMATSSIVKGGLDELDAVLLPQSAARHADNLHHLGAAVVLVSRDLDGMDVFHAGENRTLVPKPAAKVVDTTAAGDSFNAGFLHAYLKSSDLIHAVQAGQSLAATVVGHKGAIIPKDAMQQV